MADKDSIRRRIGSVLDEAGLKYQLDNDGDYWVPFEDAIVFVGPGVMGEISVAKVWAYVAVDVTGDTDSLLRYLNEQNCKMIFGKLCWYHLRGARSGRCSRQAGASDRHSHRLQGDR